MANQKIDRRTRIKRGIRKRVTGVAERPRLSVYRSNKEIYAQIIDDVAGVTLCAASSTEKDIAGNTGDKTSASVMVGKALAAKAVAAGITQVVFDRNGYLYHGRVKALAEGAREGGLNF
jgi:large subunit ribosomal protein L18